jgi:DNA-binding NarL/FixJ family response regulator/Tfp pilus assembly protein PilF
MRGWGERIHESLRLQKQAHELYIALGDPFRATLGDQGIGIIYLALGEVEQAQAYTQRGYERAYRYGVQRILGLLHCNKGIIALTQGDWASCEIYLQQAMQEAQRHDDARLKPVVLLTQAELRFRCGQWHEAEQLFQNAMQAATNTEWQVASIALYGHFLAVTGRRAAAQVQLDRASEFPERLGSAGSFYIPFLAEGYLHLNTIERATSYFERITRLRGFLYFGISVDRILGELATLNKNWGAADRCFEDGLRLCRRAGNEPEEAAILYEQARLAIIRNDSIQHITDLCTQAHTLFLHYNMQRAAALVTTLLEGVKSLQSPKQQASQPASKPQTAQQELVTAGYVLHLKLSAREQEVLQLVAEGHTDREVADILVLSPRTVNRHLSNIFVKLDVPSRAAAVAYAIRQGLV